MFLDCFSENEFIYLKKKSIFQTIFSDLIVSEFFCLLARIVSQITRTSASPLCNQTELRCLGGGKGDANGENNKTIDESVSSSAKKENADSNMSLSEEEESIGGESGKTSLSAGASGEVGRGGRRGSRGHDIVIEENPDAASQAGASMTAGHMYVTKLENKSDYEAGVGISATVSFEPRSDERWGGGGGTGAGMQQPQNFQPGTNSGSSAAIPDYMMGLQPTYANQVGSEVSLVFV